MEMGVATRLLTTQLPVHATRAWAGPANPAGLGTSPDATGGTIAAGGAGGRPGIPSARQNWFLFLIDGPGRSCPLSEPFQAICMPMTPMTP